MRTVQLPLVLAALLGGCAVVPPSAWDFDPMAARARTVPAPEQYAAWSGRVAQLQAERSAIQARIAVERDVWRRQREYAQLHRVGMTLSPLERQLADAMPAR